MSGVGSLLVFLVFAVLFGVAIKLLLIPFFAAYQLKRLVDAHARERFERSLREPYCLECGYDLRRSNERCPECGSAIPPEQRNIIAALKTLEQNSAKRD